MKGWVYVISNKAMPGLVKIGFTLKDPELRAAELNNTGAPHPYVVDYEALVEEPRTIEQKAHRALNDKREGKEWFRTTPEEATATIKLIIGNNMHVESHKHVDPLQSEKIGWKKKEDERKMAAEAEHRNSKIQKLTEERQKLNDRHKSELQSMQPDINFWFTYAGVVFVVIIALEILTGQTGSGIWTMGAVISLVITPFITGYLHNKEKEKPEYQKVINKQRNELANINEEIARLRK